MYSDLIQTISRWLAIPTCFLLFTVVGTCQRSDQSILVGEAYGIDCEKQRSLMDGLLDELRKTPASTGLVVIHNDLHDPVAAYKQKAIIEGHLKFRRFDQSRIEFELGPHGGESPN